MHAAPAATAQTQVRVNRFIRSVYFLRSSGMSMIISYIGVLVFVGLTAYDTQKIKNMALSQPAGLDAGVIRKGALLGALFFVSGFYKPVFDAAENHGEPGMTTMTTMTDNREWLMTILSGRYGYARLACT